MSADKYKHIDPAGTTECAPRGVLHGGRAPSAIA